jgi:hypothetical protein
LGVERDEGVEVAQRRCDQRDAHSFNWRTVVAVTATRIVATDSRWT